jgi:hypothetical protein
VIRKAYEGRGDGGAMPGLRTFFCNRTTLVHFFSNKPSYFFAFAASNTSSPRPISARSAAAVLRRLLEAR